MTASLEQAVSVLSEHLRELGESLPQPALEDDLQLLRRRFPGSGTDRLRDWFSLCDGAALNDSELLGLRSQGRVASLFEIRRDIPLGEGWLPIGDDRCGNWYCVPCDIAPFYGMTPVVFMDALSPATVAYAVASDIARFVVELVRADQGEDRWPFDKVYTLTRDSEIERLPLPLPWDVG